MHCIILALVDVGAYALRSDVLHRARKLPKDLHIGLGHGVVRLEEVIHALILLVTLRISFSRHLHTLNVSGVMILVQVL